MVALRKPAAIILVRITSIEGFANSCLTTASDILENISEIPTKNIKNIDEIMKNKILKLDLKEIFRLNNLVYEDDKINEYMHIANEYLIP